MSTSNAVPGFLPSTHGLHFRNQFAAGPMFRFGPIATGFFGVADASNGLCGGMAWLVRERFEAGQPIPPDTQAPANGSSLFQALVRRQVKSLEWSRTPIRFWWIGAFGPERTARKTRESEWQHIRATIDTGRLAMVGLVRHKGISPLNLTKSHQVLAYAYDVEGETLTLSVYDPNHPNEDDVAVILEPNGIRQSTREPLFGVVALA